MDSDTRFETSSSVSDVNIPEQDSASHAESNFDQNENNNNNNDDPKNDEFQFGPRVRARSQRPAISALSTMSAPPSEARFSGAFDQRDGSPTRSPLAGGRSPPSTMRSLLTRGTSPGRSDGNLNGLVDMAAFRDARDAEFQDGSTHRAGSVSLPSATWTPPSLRHFGFPSEFKDFLEVYVIRLISPWTEKAVNVVREDFQQFPENWKNIPHGRRVLYAVTAFVSGYYFLISLYAIPLVALGFITPAFICRKYLEHEESETEAENAVNNNNNDDVNNLIVSVKEMSSWMKFWVTFCGWLLVSNLAPGFVSAVLPLKILTIVFVLTSLVVPWKSNPANFVYDRVLLPVFQSIDEHLVTLKDKFLSAVSNVDLQNGRRQ